MLIKILSLIVNFNLIFQPLTFNLYLSSLLNSKVQAQNTTSDSPQFEVEIVPIATASSTDITYGVGSFLCNPYEGNVFVPSPYGYDANSGKIETYKTFIDKVRDRIGTDNDGCESIWPQILFRFKINTTTENLSKFLTKNPLSTTFSVKLNLNFREASKEVSKDLNIIYKIEKDSYKDDLISNTYIDDNNPAKNVFISSYNGRPLIFGLVSQPTTTAVAQDPKDSNKSYFDLYLSLRSHYYFRDEPYLDPIIDYENKHVTTTHPEFPKRFIIKSISFEVNGQNLIKNVKFFKDAKSYGDYLEGIENSVDIEVSTTTFENIEFTTDKNDKLKGIVGFFPAFIESLPHSFADTIFGESCKYYQEKENGPIILLPYQFAAVYSVSVSATGNCDQPPIYDNGISTSTDNTDICLKYTNRVVPCSLYGPNAPISTSLCMTGFPLFNKFDNGYYYINSTTKEAHWKIDDPKGYRIIKKINMGDIKFPSMAHFFNAGGDPNAFNENIPTDDYGNITTNVRKIAEKIKNDDNFKNLFKKRRIFSYQKLSYASSSSTTYPITSLDQLLGEGAEATLRKINELKATGIRDPSSPIVCTSDERYYAQKISNEYINAKFIKGYELKQFLVYKCYPSSLKDSPYKSYYTFELGILPESFKGNFQKDIYHSYACYGYVESDGYWYVYRAYGGGSKVADYGWYSFSKIKCTTEEVKRDGSVEGPVPPFQLGKDYFVLGNDLDIFVRPPGNIQFSAPTSTPVSGAVFILNQPSTKYELSLLNYLPRIYRDNPVSYQFKAVSPFSIKNGTLARNINSYFQDNEFYPNYIFGNTFSNFYTFTSLCTLPQHGFEAKLTIAESVIPSYAWVPTEECAEFNPPYQCREVYYPEVYQCLPSATATILASYDIKYYAQDAPVSIEEKAKATIDNLAALTEYREKGKNISRIKFEIAEIASSPNQSITQLLPVAELEYEREYTPPPYLAQYVDFIVKNVWNMTYAPDEVKNAAQQVHHNVVQEVFSSLPIFLSLKKISTSTNSNVSFEKIPQKINLSVFTSKINFSEETIKRAMPWLYAFLKTLSTGLKALYVVMKAVGFLLQFVPGGQAIGLALIEIADYIYLAALIADGALLAIYGGTAEQWIMFGLDTLAFFFYTDLGKKTWGLFLKGINWVASGIGGLGKNALNYIADISKYIWDKISCSPEGIATWTKERPLYMKDPTYFYYLPNLKYAFAQKEMLMTTESNKVSLPLCGGPLDISNTPQRTETTMGAISEDLMRQMGTEMLLTGIWNAFSIGYEKLVGKQKHLILAGQMIPRVLSQVLIGKNLASRIPEGLFAVGAVLNIVSGMATLFSLGKLYKDLTKEVKIYKFQSLGISYGYKIEGLKINLDTQKRTYAPIFTLIGRPVFDPDYPEYGYYEPVRRFYGDPVVASTNCKTLSCEINTSTTELKFSVCDINNNCTPNDNQSLKDFNISNISNDRYTFFNFANDCITFATSTQILVTTTAPLSQTFTIATFTEDYVGGSMKVESFLAKLKIFFEGGINSIVNEKKEIITGTTSIPSDFMGSRTTTIHSFIKANSTSTLFLKSKEWDLINSSGRQIPGEYKCNTRTKATNVYNFVSIQNITNYKINCANGTKLKWKGMDVANTCLGWVCEYEPQWQPSLQEVTTTPSQ
jgi:hypothetical protein